MPLLHGVVVRIVRDARGKIGTAGSALNELSLKRNGQRVSNVATVTIEGDRSTALRLRSDPASA
jgi:hypothetical protein